MRGTSRNVVASLVTALSGIAVALLVTPLVLAHVGRSGYGVWSISMAFLVYLGIAESGLAPVVQRHIALAGGAGDPHAARGVFWTTLAAYLAAGLAAFALIELLAPVVAGLFAFPGALERQATDLLRIIGLAAPLGLAMAALANLLQGLGRFVAVAATSVAGSLALLIALLALIGADASLAQLGWAVVAQQVVLVVGRCAVAADVLRGRPRLASRAQVRSMAGMSARLQATVLSVLVNGQSDKVVTGFVAPPATVGQVAIAAQLAESGRLVATAPLVPLATRFAALAGAGDVRHLRSELRRLERLWVVAVLGGVLIGLACARPLVAGWLGDGFGQAEAFAAVLILAYGANLLTGARVAYLRAIGEVGPEARMGMLLIALNVAFTVPLAIVAGAGGVVGGTLGAYALGTAWFAVHARRAVPDLPPAPAVRSLGRALAAGLPAAALAGVWGSAAVALVPTGWALALVGVGALGAYALFVPLALGVRPTPSGARAALGGHPGGARDQAPAATRGTSTVQAP